MLSKKVVLVVYNDFLTDNRVTKEANSLAHAGFHVSVCAVHYPGKTLEVEESKHFSVRRIDRRVPLLQPFLSYLDDFFSRKANTTKSRMISWLRIIVKIPNYVVLYFKSFFHLIREKPDIVHANDINTLPVVYLAAKFSRFKIVYDAHELCFDQEGLRQLTPFLKLLEGFLVKRVDRMFTTTDMRAREFQAQYGVSLPRVISNKPVYKKIEKSERIRTVLSLDKKPIALYQGMVQKGRGLFNLLSVAERLPEVNFVVIGDGALKQGMQEEVLRREIQNLYFIPKVLTDELHEYTCSADVGLQLIQNTCKNHYTTDSNKLYEYLMADLFVVASDFPEIRRVLESNPKGSLVDPENIDQIVQAIKIGLEVNQTRENVEGVSAHSWDHSEEPKLIEEYSQIVS